MDQRHLGEACLAFERWDRFAMLIESGATDLGDHDVRRRRQHAHDLVARVAAIGGCMKPPVDSVQALIAVDRGAMGATPDDVG